AAENSCSFRNPRSTLVGVLRRRIHDTATIIDNPSTSPMIGATTINTSVFVHPFGRITLNQVLQPCRITWRAIAAPASPPINACEDEVGSPHHHVSKSQTIAPTSAASTTYCVMMSSRTKPWPIVLATAVPNRNAATKLKNAAQMTASRGDNTRVETTVAMLLAESWKPLRKSNVSATATVTQSRTIPEFTRAILSLTRVKRSSARRFPAHWRRLLPYRSRFPALPAVL